jgi:hypothetical protein
MRIATRLAISSIAVLFVTAAVADDHRPAVSKATVSHHYKGTRTARGSVSFIRLPAPPAQPEPTFYPMSALP